MKRRFLKLLARPRPLPHSFLVRAETLGLNGKIAPSKSAIAMGCIGIGSQGGLHLKNRRWEISGIEVVALCDVAGTSNSQSFKDGQDAGASDCFHTGDFREVLARPEVDAVLIALPDHWHALPVILLLAAKTVLHREAVFHDDSGRARHGQR